MENFIIVLISIGALLYNLYKNYQKEIEKSKSRTPNRRPQPIPEVINIPASERIKPVVTKELPKEYNYTSEIPAEVLAAQERRRVQNLTSPKITPKIQELEIVKNEIDFDLRKAVIQSIILERPYK